MESVEKLSTIFVDNLFRGMLPVERVDNLSITAVDTSKEVKVVTKK